MPTNIFVQGTLVSLKKGRLGCLTPGCGLYPTGNLHEYVQYMYMRYPMHSLLGSLWLMACPRKHLLCLCVNAVFMLSSRSASVCFCFWVNKIQFCFLLNIKHFVAGSEGRQLVRSNDATGMQREFLVKMVYFFAPSGHHRAVLASVTVNLLRSRSTCFEAGQ